jgi:hypothetical protein
LSATPQASRPARVTQVFDDGVLELSIAIQSLGKDDTLGKVELASSVLEVKELEVTVAAPEAFEIGDVVVRLGADVETSAPSTVVDKKDKALKLASKIDGLSANGSLGIAKAAAKVLTVESSTAAVVVDVPKEDVKLFRTGDLVAKLTAAGGASAPVRIAKTSKKGHLTLDQPISGLAENDVIGAATFGVRATVLSLSGTTVTIDNVGRFPVGSYVARLDEQLAPLACAQVTLATNGVLSLELGGLAIGDVIGLCAFPKQVTVSAIAEDGKLTLSDPALLPHETVAALPQHGGVALVASVDASVVKLASPIADLAVGDLLSVVDMEGTIDVKTVQGKKLTFDDVGRLRPGDVIGRIVGYRSADRQSPPAMVTRTDGKEVFLTRNIDGLLPGDIVGLPDLPSYVGSVRLDSLQDLLPGDEVLLEGIDRLSGESTSTTGRIYYVDVPRKRVWLYAIPSLAGVVRPGDLAASVLFVRGSALALIRKQDLFVSWLGVEDSQPMPRPCAGSPPDDCPCASDKEQ